MSTTDYQETSDETTLDTDWSEDQEQPLSKEEFEKLQRSYKELQADYTRKSQRLSELEKQPNTSTDEETQTIQRLKERGFVSKEELENIQTQAQRETEFRTLLETNPSLKKYEGAIRKLQWVDWKSYEEVILENGFLSQDRLEKAKSSRDRLVSWMETTSSKSLLDLSPEEYEKWKKEQGITGSKASLLKRAW